MLFVLGNCLANKILHKEVQGLGDASGKYLLHKHEEPSSYLPHSHKRNLSMAACIRTTTPGGGRDRGRQIPGAHWPGSLTEWMVSEFSERNCPDNFWSPCAEALVCLCTTHEHMQTCTCPQECGFVPLTYTPSLFCCRRACRPGIPWAPCL